MSSWEQVSGSKAVMSSPTSQVLITEGDRVTAVDPRPDPPTICAAVRFSISGSVVALERGVLRVGAAGHETFSYLGSSEGCRLSTRSVDCSELPAGIT